MEFRAVITLLAAVFIIRITASSDSAASNSSTDLNYSSESSQSSGNPSVTEEIGRTHSTSTTTETSPNVLLNDQDHLSKRTSTEAEIPNTLSEDLFKSNGIDMVSQNVNSTDTTFTGTSDSTSAIPFTPQHSQLTTEPTMKVDLTSESYDRSFGETSLMNTPNDPVSNSVDSLSKLSSSSQSSTETTTTTHGLEESTTTYSSALVHESQESESSMTSTTLMHSPEGNSDSTTRNVIGTTQLIERNSTTGNLSEERRTSPSVQISTSTLSNTTPKTIDLMTTTSQSSTETTVDGTQRDESTDPLSSLASSVSAESGGVKPITEETQTFAPLNMSSESTTPYSWQTSTDETKGNESTDQSTISNNSTTSGSVWTEKSPTSSNMNDFGITTKQITETSTNAPELNGTTDMNSELNMTDFSTTFYTSTSTTETDAITASDTFIADNSSSTLLTGTFTMTVATEVEKEVDFNWTAETSRETTITNPSAEADTTSVSTRESMVLTTESPKETVLNSTEETITITKQLTESMQLTTEPTTRGVHITESTTETALLITEPTKSGLLTTESTTRMVPTSLPTTTSTNLSTESATTTMAPSSSAKTSVPANSTDIFNRTSEVETSNATDRFPLTKSTTMTTSVSITNSSNQQDFMTELSLLPFNFTEETTPAQTTNKTMRHWLEYDLKFFKDLTPNEKRNIVTMTVKKYLEEKEVVFFQLWIEGTIIDGIVRRLVNWSAVKAVEHQAVNVEDVLRIVYIIRKYPKSPDERKFSVFVNCITNNATMPGRLLLGLLKRHKQRLQNETKIETIEFTLGLGGNTTESTSETEEFFEEYSILIGVLSMIVFVGLLVLVFATYSRRKAAIYCLNDTDTLDSDMQNNLEVGDICPEEVILKDEIQENSTEIQTNGKTAGAIDETDVWVVPVNQVPRVDNNAPSQQDTKL